MLEYAELKGNVGAAKTIVENIVHQFFDTKKVSELGRAVLEAKDDQGKKVLVNDPVLRKGIAEELRKNPGQMKGDTGVQGAPGLKGDKGNIGSQGTKGEAGIDGTKGTKGDIGPKGLDGVSGSMGIKGDIGEKGDTGASGIDGLPGTPGLKGDKGNIGSQGTKGETGIDGTKGTKGDIGPKGLDGVSGSMGIKGDIGEKGDTGASGIDGLPGAQGPKGDKGNIGPIGPQGLQGSKGHIGRSGPKGDMGDQGLQGQKGERGFNGTQGGKGDIGPQGFKGADGLPGTPGSKGIDASPEEVAQKLINNGTIANEILEYREEGDLVLEQQIAGRLIYDKNIHEGIATELIENRAKELAEALLNSANDTLVEKFTNSTELIQSISEELRKNPGKIQGPKGDIGLQGIPGIDGPKGSQGIQGLKGERGFNGTQGEKGDIGATGPVGLKGDMGDKGNAGVPGSKGDQGLVGSKGLKGGKGEQGPQGFNGTQGEPGINGLLGMPGPKGEKGDIGLQGPKGHVGKFGLKGDKGDTGSAGKDGIGADVANQFLREINQTSTEIRVAKEAVESDKNASEKAAKQAQENEDEITKLHTEAMNLTKEAKAFKEEADNLADKAFQSKKEVEVLHSKVKDIFCKMDPGNQICPAPRGKRGIEKLNNLLAVSGASRPISLISQVMNFFYPFIGQDRYMVENKAQELHHVEKIIAAVDIITKFEKALEEASLKCGIAKKNLNFDPVELQSTIINKSLLNDENHNELLQFLCVTAKKSLPNYKQTSKCLSTFKDHMEKRLKDNEQQRAFINTEKIMADNEQPRSFMSSVAPPSSLSAINQEFVGYLR